MLLQSKLKFRCSACRSTLKVPLHRRGTYLHCPRCHQRLLAPLSSETRAAAQPDEAAFEVLPMLPAILRFAAWTACVGWVSYLVWLHCNPLDLLKGTVPGLSISLAVGVQLLGAYIAARAVEGVTR
jgi:DNA-directed RNA polymerase subunit RPC12/RpoP